MTSFVIEILDGDRAGETVPLREGSLRIGRKPGNQLVIKDEKASGEHAEVVFEDGRFVLRDLDSTNGTLMDGHQVQEVALTPGDTFHVGRTRLRFRAEGEDDATLQMHRLDKGRLAKTGRSRSAAVLGILIVAAAAGGYWYLRGDGVAADGGGGPTTRAELEVAGNRLAQPIAACEQAEGWELRAAGLPFEIGSEPHTGRTALSAFHPGADSEETDDFAVARLSEPLTVLPDSTLTVAAHLRTRGAAMAMLRLRFSSSLEDYPFTFHPGTAAAAYRDYTRVELSASVPKLADRAQVELVALLPEPGSVVSVDDVAVLDGGNAEVVDARVPETGQTLIGSEDSIAVESTDPTQRAVLLALRPHVTDGPLLGLHRAGLTRLGDVGVDLEVEVVPIGFVLRANGVLAGAGGLELEFPPESGGGLLVRDEGDEFTSVAAEGTVRARDVLLGAGLLRCMVSVQEPRQWSGEATAGIYRLTLPATETVTLHLNFREQRAAAFDKLRQAERALGQGRPGEALDRIRELQRTLPHDTQHLRRSQDLRSEILAELERRVQDVRADLERAEFFDTRGGFARVIESVDDLLARYGEHNIEEIESLQGYRSQAEQRLMELDEQRTADHRARLQRLAEIFANNDEEQLAQLIREYLK